MCPEWNICRIDTADLMHKTTIAKPHNCGFIFFCTSTPRSLFIDILCHVSTKIQRIFVDKHIFYNEFLLINTFFTTNFVLQKNTPTAYKTIRVSFCRIITSLSPSFSSIKRIPSEPDQSIIRQVRQYQCFFPFFKSSMISLYCFLIKHLFLTQAKKN